MRVAVATPWVWTVCGRGLYMAMPWVWTVWARAAHGDAVGVDGVCRCGRGRAQLGYYNSEAWCVFTWGCASAVASEPSVWTVWAARGIVCVVGGEGLGRTLLYYYSGQGLGRAWLYYYSRSGGCGRRGVGVGCT